MKWVILNLNASIEENAALNHVSTTTIINRFKQRGVALPKRRRGRKKKLVILNLNASIQENAALNHVSSATIASRLMECGGTLPRHRRERSKSYSPPPRYMAVDWTRNDCDIARDLDISRESVRQIRKKCAIPKVPKKKSSTEFHYRRTWRPDPALTAKENAKRLGVLPNRVREVARILGMTLKSHLRLLDWSKLNLKKTAVENAKLLGTTPGCVWTHCWRRGIKLPRAKRTDRRKRINPRKR